MKITYVSPMHFDEASCLGGGERYPLNVARGVVAASDGRHVVDFLSHGNLSQSGPLEEGINLRVMRYAAPPVNPIDPRSWELPDALADADVVHVHQAFTRSSEIAMLVAKHRGVPLCVTDHGGHTSNLGASMGILDLADRVICNSDFSASLIRTTAPVEVVKGGVDSWFFMPRAVPQARGHVLYVGRLLPHKGIDMLLAAIPSELPLVVCGRVHDRRYAQFLVSLAKRKQVRFITDASDDDLLDFYRRAWATVLPSVHTDCFGGIAIAPELMGLSLLESMSCGTPAICSRVAGMPEFVRHGDTGYVYDSLAEMVSYLRYLVAEPSVLEAMGRRARSAVEREFSLAVVGERVTKIYERLVRDPQVGGRQRATVPLYE